MKEPSPVREREREREKERGEREREKRERRERERAPCWTEIMIVSILLLEKHRTLSIFELIRTHLTSSILSVHIHDNLKIRMR